MGVARALAADPPILLCDEAFGALDPITRVQIRKEFKSLVHGLGKTVVFVTHDVREAIDMADRLVLLDDGAMTFEGTADEFRASSNPAILALLSLA